MGLPTTTALSSQFKITSSPGDGDQFLLLGLLLGKGHGILADEAFLAPVDHPVHAGFEGGGIVQIGDQVVAHLGRQGVGNGGIMASCFAMTLSVHNGTPAQPQPDFVSDQAMGAARNVLS